MTRLAVVSWVLLAGGGAGASAQSSVGGVVYDSLARGPLAGAHVQLVPTDPARQDDGRRTTTTDSAGEFRLPEVPPGRYLAGFFHARLDSLGLEPVVHRVEVRPGRPLALELAVPGAASVIAAWCGPAAASDSTGVILGYTRDAGSTAPWGQTRVAAQWRTITITRAGARAGVQGTQASATPRGWFSLCGVPRGGVVVLRASRGADSSAVLEVEVPEDGILRRDIAFAGEGSVAVTHPVRGLVRDAAGEPVAGARVRWWGAATEVRADARGMFQLAPLALGTQLLDVRMVGFVPTRLVVDVGPEPQPLVEIALADFPMEIDTVRVLARRPRQSEALGGFERRQRLGHGVFLDAEAIERRRPLVFTDLLRGTAGVEVRSIDMMTRAVRMRATNGIDACVPVLVVDGMRLPMHDMNLDDVIPADLVRAIEVYPRRLQAPPEFQDETCGSLVVWTGLRGWLARQRPGARKG